MTEDWFVAAVERVAAAGRQACLAIETAVGALQEGREARAKRAGLLPTSSMC